MYAMTGWRCVLGKVNASHAMDTRVDIAVAAIEPPTRRCAARVPSARDAAQPEVAQQSPPS